MYHPRTIAAAAKKLEAAYEVTLKESSVSQCEEMEARLRTAVDEKGATLRALSPEEQAFVRNELLLSKVDFRYAISRYFKIRNKDGLVQRLTPLLGSQEFVLSKLAEFEVSDRFDGILVNVLKATRQVGMSVLADSLVLHRGVTQDNVTALVASDTPERTAHLADITEKMVDELPWWLRPRITDRQKNKEIKFDGGSEILFDSGKSMKGQEGKRGQMGRGMTILSTHLSELSTFEDPDQLQGSLFPAIPRNRRSLAFFETTAQGRGTWFHKHWKDSRAGKTRFKSIYIPWYVQKEHALPAPPGWSPAPPTLEHAKRVEATSAAMIGKQFKPSRDQLYWYETVRAEYEAIDKLHDFLQEYGSVDDDECFQTGGRSVLSAKVLDRLQQFVRPPAVQLEVAALRGGSALQ